MTHCFHAHPHTTTVFTQLRSIGFLLTFLSVSFAATQEASPQTKEPYLWPLKKERIITSSFAEYRPGRFHAGIDLRTGAIGEPVYAPADGYISRVRCSPWGYGKALYLTLHDGNTVVFGHLSDFMPPVREYVRHEQHQRENYTVDLFPDRSLFPVKQGDCIAWSGDTGVGPAHLHYEIRDSANRAINPRQLGISWHDESPPQIRGVLVAPDAPTSSINGDIIPKIISVHPTGTHQYSTDPVYVSGRCSFAVDTVDPANQNQNTLGIYRTSTFLNEQEIFRTQNDLVSYDFIHHGVVCWHPFCLKEGQFLLQWRWQGNRSESLSNTPSDGWISAPAAPSVVRIEVEDSCGNRAEVKIPLQPMTESMTPSNNDPHNEPAPNGSVRFDCYGQYLTVTATFPSPEPEPPVLGITGNQPDDLSTPFRRISPNVYRAGYQPSTTTQSVSLWADHPRLPNETLHAAIFHRGNPPREERMGNVVIRASEHSPFGTLFAQVDEVKSPKPSKPLPRLGKAYRIWPEASPIDEPVQIRFPFPKGAQRPERVEIYSLAGSGWTRQSTKRVGKELQISTQRFGTFAALEDTVEPSVQIVSPEEGAQTSRRPAIRIKVSDIGSGMADIRITANGKWLLTEYDPEASSAQWVEDEDLPTGNVTIRVEARDNVGNTRTVERLIHVGQPQPPSN